jgi:serine/threonine protein kinase/Tol biopolymer transport system component
MQLSSGSRLGPYEIVARLGAGGMGEVWRARDTRLDRSVAIKVLPASLAQNAQLRIRFEREAKTISQLNHPNICTLYDVGDDYLVMELLEGESLAEKLAKGPLPLADVLRYGAQIADALDRAHRHGVVHRDVKPGNVMISRGTAKLLDFGLAKSGAFEVNPDAPTQQVAPITEQGTILGTFQYMAPEQLEGLEADPRTDIFALGAMLYEMATARRAFEGKTRTSLIAAIVGGEPKPLAEILAVTPPALEHTITKCLRKDPDDRWQSAHDVAEELRWIAEQLARPEVVAQRRSAKLPWAIAALALLAAIVASVFVLRSRGTATTPTAFIVLPNEGTFSSSAALSPDGRAIAFTVKTANAPSQLFVRRLDEIEAKPIAGAGAALRPNWSPDGRSIAFFGNQLIHTVDVAGGTPRPVCPSGYGVGAAWGDDDTLIFSPTFGEGLFRVPVSGGKPAPLTKLDAARGETGHIWPVHIPKSSNYLFLNHTVPRQPAQVSVITPGGAPKMLLEATSLLGYSDPYLVFERRGVIYAQELDTSKMAMRGTAAPIVDNVTRDASWITCGGSVSGDVLAYSHRPPKRIAYRWSTPGSATLFETSDAEGATLSPDERSVLFMKRDPASGSLDLWRYDLRRGLQNRVVEGNIEGFAWSPDGKQIAYSSDTDGLFDVFVVAADGSSPPEKLWGGLSADKNVIAWSPDGTQLLMRLEFSGRGTDIWLFDLRTKTGRPLLATDYVDVPTGFSPDGQWIAYTSNRSGREEAYIRKLSSGETIQISTNGGRNAEFAKDGNAVYYQIPGMLMKVPLARSGTSYDPGAPQPALSLERLVGRDFRRDGVFIVGESVGEVRNEELHVITGWKSRLQATR